MSTLKANQIQHTANGAATFTLPQTDGSANQVIKTDGSGNLSFVAQPSSGLSNVVQFRLSQTVQQDNGNANETLTHWEKSDETGAGQIGTFADPSSGVFTFPSTGIWRIDYNVQILSTYASGTRYFSSRISATTDDSSYSFRTNTRTVAQDGEYEFIASHYIFDVSNVSTHKVKFIVRGQDGNVYYRGSTTENETYVTFMRLGDT